jgi:hypothetical protein
VQLRFYPQLSLVANQDGTEVFASGIDNCVTQFVYVAGNDDDDDGASDSDSDLSGGGGQWVLSTKQRSHTHDVQCLALSPPLAANNTGLPQPKQKARKRSKKHST